LFDRLAARLGADRVCRPVLVADYRPERAMAWQPVRDAASAPDVAPVGAPRPAWLLPEPQCLAEDKASGQPLYRGAPLTLQGRPERIEAGWFDGALVSRDYLVAEACDRRCLWVFRERRGDGAPQWYLHGVFG
jgi:protein ImuB